MSLAGLHAKVYVLDNRLALVTSANATHSGMNRNWECGVALEEPDEIEEVATLLLKGFGAAQAPQRWNADEIETLREPVKVLRRQLPPMGRAPLQDASGLPAIRLKRKSKSALLAGFSGWIRLVLEAILALDESSFSLDELENMCRPLVAAQFPRNRHVREKIRQQLQRLRDLGLVEFVGGGNYLRTISS